MLVKSLFLLFVTLIATVFAGDDDDSKNLDVSKIENRIEFVTNYNHTPETGIKEGDILTIDLDPPAEKDAAKVAELVKFFSIAIGTGEGSNVNEEFFMESERFPIPTAHMTYKFQLPAQMEDKEYCIVYTPYVDETSNEKPMMNDVPMESLYNVWFPIKGSLAEGSGPATAENTFKNDMTAQAGNNAQAGTDNTQAQPQAGADQNGQQTTDRSAQPQTNEKSSSITISPAITAFIAVLFACFFI